MLSSIRWDADLIRRYDHAGPRYTSYPTAVQFHDGIRSTDYVHALENSRANQRSIYISRSARIFAITVPATRSSPRTVAEPVNTL